MTVERLEVGRIGKAHGLKGEVVVDFITDRVEERTRIGTELWADGSPMRVVSARPHQKKWLIVFDGVIDRTQAEQLKGIVLTAPPIDDPEALFVHDLIGKQVVDQHGVAQGEIAAIVENPASDLMELTDGTLVPMAFVVAQNDTTVEVSVPLGLFADAD